MARHGETFAPHGQFTMSGDMVSWRHQQVTISGNALKTINYNDTSPNMFMIQNSTPATLYVGISAIPTLNSYEFKVAPNSSKTFGRPISTNELFILNLSNADITINLYSVLDKFDLGLMSDTTVTMEESVLKEIKGDGIIKGYGAGVKLPSGDNHIGDVTIDGPIDAYVHSLPSLPAGSNLIGKVEVTNQPENSGLSSDELHAVLWGANGANYDLRSIFSKLDDIQTDLNAIKAVVDKPSMPFFKKMTNANYASATTINLPYPSYNYIGYVKNNSNKVIQLNITNSSTSEFGLQLSLQPGESVTEIYLDNSYDGLSQNYPFDQAKINVLGDTADFSGSFGYMMAEI